MSDKTIDISLIQADLIWEDTDGNLQKIDELLKQVPKETELVILPEMFSTGFTMNVNNLEKPVGQKAFYWLKETVRKTKKIIIGSILTEEDNRYYNRMYWMRPDGSFDYYDKRHLFHQGGEDKVMTAGNRKVIFNYKDNKILLQICYDLRFPVWSKNNYDVKTDSYDYDAVIYIANWPESRRYAYENLLKARAIENQAIVIWVNRIGADKNGIFHSGDSQVIAGNGEILAKAVGNKEQIISYSIDFLQLNSLRNNFKVGLDWDKFMFL